MPNQDRTTKQLYGSILYNRGLLWVIYAYVYHVYRPDSLFVWALIAVAIMNFISAAREGD